MPAAGDPITRWHSVQLPAEHWSVWCHTIPIVVATTSTINRAETMTRLIRVGSVIASEPFKSLNFFDTPPILNGTDALSGSYPKFDRVALGEIGRPMGKFTE